MYNITFLNRSMSTVETYADEETEHDAKHLVSMRKDFDTHVSSERFSDEHADLIRSGWRPTTTGDLKWIKAVDRYDTVLRVSKSKKSAQQKNKKWEVFLEIDGCSLTIPFKTTSFRDALAKAMCMFQECEVLRANEIDNKSNSLTDDRPIAGDPKLFIEDMGYDIDVAGYKVHVDDEHPCLWIWTAFDDGSERSFHSAKEALDDAWANAVARTLVSHDITSEQWNQMGLDTQRVAMTLALSGGLPPLSELSPDTQMEWVERVREVYSDIGPVEAFRLANQEYRENDGVLPRPAAAAAESPARTARTSDGYAFTEQPDGTWSDGDMTFDSLAQLMENDPDVLVDGLPVAPNSGDSCQPA